MSSLNSEKVKPARKVVNADDAYLAMCSGTLAISHTSVRCRACEGHGFRELSVEDMQARADGIAAATDTKARDQLRKDLSAETTCQVCLGIGYTTQRRADRATAMDSMFTTVRCGRCRGCGEVTTPTDTSAERQDACLGCGGAGYFVPVTVKDRGSTKHGRAPALENAEAGDYPPSHTVSASHATQDDVEAPQNRHTAESLERLGAADPRLAAALASYYGPDGDQWVDHRWGRAFAVWQHTDSAKSLAAHLAETSHRGAGFLQDVTTLLKGARAAQECGELPKTRDGALVRVLLGRVHTEARELLGRVERVADRVGSAA